MMDEVTDCASGLFLTLLIMVKLNKKKKRFVHKTAMYPLK
jgi:hypothetical protein